MMTPETTINKNTLFANMAKVMGDITRIPKSGVNKHFNYPYATDSDVSDMIRPLLAEHNIAFFADMKNVHQENGYTRVTFEFTFACGETGATITNTWVGEATDKGDKGISKAATAAEKYFLLKTFVASTGDTTDDADDHDGTRQEVDPMEWVRQSVAAELKVRLDDNELAKLAGIPSFTRESLKEKYGDAKIAVAAIVAAYKAPATPKTEPQPETIASNGHQPKQPALIDAPEKQEVEPYDHDPFPKN